MAAATLAIIAGVSTAMFLRKKKSWLKIHKLFNSAGILLITVGVTMAVIYISGTSNKHFNGFHQITGLITFVFAVTTFRLGLYQFKAKNKSAARMAHRWLGRVSLVMLLMAVILGLMLINII
jgi:fucose 4-O-acetylase-like acetyltransferase